MTYKLTLSIAMCTYNGAKYLQKQLDSIAAQSRLPDELIVCDDGSNDNTLDILANFKHKSSFPVKIYKNKIRLGPTKNFEKAINLCKGNIIFLCDQDDVWQNEKLETMEKIFLNNPDMGYAFTDALVVDKNLNSLGYTMWERIGFTRFQRMLFKNGHQLEILLKHNVVTGATMAFRAELKKLILPIPNQWIHDAWIASLSSAMGKSGVFIEKPLIKYRQHPNQVIGGKKIELNLYEQIEKALNIKDSYYGYKKLDYIQLFDRLNKISHIDKKSIALVKSKVKHLKSREFLYKSPLSKRVFILLAEILTGRYYKYSNGWKSMLKDLFIVFK